MKQAQAVCTRLRLASARVAALLLVGLGAALPACAQASLRATFDSLQQPLAASVFGRPLLLDSGATGADPHGDVYAVVDHRFSDVLAALQRAERWCELLVLHINVKRCTVAGAAPRQMLHVAVGRKIDQAIEDAYPVDFKYTLRSALNDHLAVSMMADNGPLGTRDYRLALEAMPVDAKRTFIHMSYTYGSGFAARMATDAYLATVGRNKVGFSIVGHDKAGQPVYVGGVRGIAERNTMRYFLAIDAYLNGMAAPPEQRFDHHFPSTNRAGRGRRGRDARRQLSPGR